MNKKIGYLLAVLGLLVACLLTLTACGTPKLSDPIGLYVDIETQTLHWQKVKGASAYSVEVDGTAITTKQNQFVLTNLKEGEYTVKIKAVAGSEEYEDSNIVEYVFVKERESGLVYKMNANKSAYELVSIGSAGGDVVMESTFRGKPVNAIAKGAFRRCARLTSLVVGEHVKTIGESAFYACAELQSITLPAGLQSIDKNAFQNCTKLQSIVIPDGVSEISEYTFSLCKELKSVTFGAGVTTVGNYAFADCAALTEIKFNDAMTTIGEYAFSGCAALPTVTFGAELAQIGPYAFYRTAALGSVQFGNKLTTLGEAAFCESGLKSVTLPDSLTTIAILTFSKCKALESVTLGTGLQSIGAQAFWETKLHAESADVLRIGNWLISCAVEVKEIPNAASVVGIADYCFMSQPQLSSVNLPAVKYIGTGAFADCAALWEVDLSSGSLLQIGAYAFSACEQLTDVKLAAGLHTIDLCAFQGCTRLEDSGINLPRTLTKIGQRAFDGSRAYNLSRDLVYVDHWLVSAKGELLNNPKIKDGTIGIADYAFTDTNPAGVVFLPNTVAYIGRGAFYKAAYVSSVNLPRSLKVIGDYAFYGCVMRFAEGETPEEMFTLTIPEGTEYIGRSAFYNCATFLNLIVPDSVKTIGDYAFRGCAVGYQLPLEQTDADGNPLLCIGKLVMGNGVQSIGAYAFYKNPMTGSVKLPDTLTYLGKAAFSGCAFMTELKIGTGLTTIPANAFADCAALADLTLSAGVKRIEKFAFRKCVALTELVLAEGIEQVDTYAFYGCEGVRRLQLPGTLHTVGDYAFRGMKKLTAVMIPAELVNLGRHAFYGNDATFFVEAESIPATWSDRWNSAYRPVVLGAKLSDDHAFVVSFVKNSANILNLSERVNMTKPSRAGYTFLGWATTPDATTAAYAADTAKDAPDGTQLYSLWAEGEEPEPEEETTPEGEGDQSGNGAAGAGDATA